MKDPARGFEIGAMEYTVGPTGASSAVTDGLGTFITVVVVIANDLLKNQS